MKQKVPLNIGGHTFRHTPAQTKLIKMLSPTFRSKPASKRNNAPHFPDFDVIEHTGKWHQQSLSSSNQLSWREKVKIYSKNDTKKRKALDKNPPFSTRIHIHFIPLVWHTTIELTSVRCASNKYQSLGVFNMDMLSKIKCPCLLVQHYMLCQDYSKQVTRQKLYS